MAASEGIKKPLERASDCCFAVSGVSMLLPHRQSLGACLLLQRLVERALVHGGNNRIASSASRPAACRAPDAAASRARAPPTPPRESPERRAASRPPPAAKRTRQAGFVQGAPPRSAHFQGADPAISSSRIGAVLFFNWWISKTWRRSTCRRR